MSDTPSPEREVRDRLAEALWRVYFAHGPADNWIAAPPAQKFDCIREADDLLEALPSVDLTIARRVG
jgi:hypothetical protein